MKFDDFKEKIRCTFKINLDGYKEKQMKRRLDSLMSRYATEDYGRFYQLMVNDRSVLDNFLDNLTINVSEFFRDPKMFRVLEEKILPDLLHKKPSLRIWSTACANGAEPYSVAIILEDLAPGKKHVLEATDLDQKILKTAREGRYSFEAVRNVSKDRLDQYFQKDGKDFLIKKRIKERITFRFQDLLDGNFQTGYDLILYRNVAIYFNRETQKRLNQRFVHCLNDGGFLFVGGSEIIMNYTELGLARASTGFYRKDK